MEVRPQAGELLEQECEALQLEVHVDLPQVEAALWHLDGQCFPNLELYHAHTCQKDVVLLHPQAQLVHLGLGKRQCTAHHADSSA